MLLRHRKQHSHGLCLRDGDQTGRIPRPHQTPELHRLQPQATRYGCHHFGVAQVELCTFKQPLVGLNGAQQLSNQGFLRIELLLGNGVLRPEFFVALTIQFCVLEQGLVPGQLSLGLQDLNLKSTRIDLGQQLARFDRFALNKSKGFELTIDFGANHSRVDGTQCAHRRHRGRDVHLDDRSHTDGLRPGAPKPKTSTAKTTRAARASWSRT